MAGLTFQELQQMGAQPVQESTGLSFDELQKQGATPIDTPSETAPAPAAPSKPFGQDTADFVMGDLTGKGGQIKTDSFLGNVFQSTVGSHGLAGVAQLPGKTAAAISEYAPGGAHQGENLNNQAHGLFDQAYNLLQKAKTAPPETAARYRSLAQELVNSGTDLQDNAGLIQSHTDTTPGQALGTAANAALTVATGAKPNLLGEVNPAFKTLNTGTSFVNNAAKATYYGGRGIENAAIGVGFNTASNLIQGKPLGEGAIPSAVLGAAVPALGVLGSKAKGYVQSKMGDTAEGLINSLIKPLSKNFGYGKNPARGILRENIKANSIESLGTEVSNRLEKIGSHIGSIGQTLTQQGQALNLTPALAPLDKAMTEAAKTNNQTLLNSLYNVKIALTHDLSMKTSESGVPQIVKGNEKILDGVTYQDAVNFLENVRKHTRFTGNPSDDQALNNATQQVYGVARETMNKAAEKADPKLGKEIRDLNSRFSDLSSAKLAIDHREIALKRTNYLKLAETLSIPAAAIAATLSGSWSKAGAILAGELGGLALTRIGSSPATKTRVAQFLNSLAAQEREGILRSSPLLKNYYERIFGTGDHPANNVINNNTPTIPNSVQTNTQGGFSKTGAVVGGAALTGAAALSTLTSKTVATQPVKPITFSKESHNVIDGIDISKYATDPKHEEKVYKIHSSLPEFKKASEITNYIQERATGSKVKGQDILDAAKKYNVSYKLLISIMQNDSQFGSKGLGKKTNNPGNVGNTDSGRITKYKTTRDGVFAVAKTLANYKK